MPGLRVIYLPDYEKYIYSSSTLSVSSGADSRWTGLNVGVSYDATGLISIL